MAFSFETNPEIMTGASGYISLATGRVRDQLASWMSAVA